MLTYVVGPPIRRTADFYGRSQQVARFYEIIAGTLTQSVSVLGVRRAGKTSFLQYVSNQEVISRYVPNPRDYVMVHIDMSFCRTPHDFYQRLYANLGKKLSGTKQLNLWRSMNGQTSLYDIETILCQHSHRRIILLLDEFDQIRTGPFDENFLTELRAMTSVLDYELAIVTASYWNLYQLGTHIGLPPTSPFYNIFYPTPIYLPGLAYAEAEALIRQPVAQTGLLFSDTEVADIYALSGSLPFFLQATAAQWFERRLYGQPPTFEDLLGRLVLEMSPYFAQWWRSLKRCEQLLLLKIANKAALPEAPCSQADENEARRRLTAYGLLTPGLNDLALNGAIFANWIQKYARLINAQSSKPPEEQVDIVSLHRIIVDVFSGEELQTLCFYLGIGYDDLRGDTRTAKARELIIKMKGRKNGLERLLTAVRRERGEIV
jgi:hypothetical protein